MRVRWSSGLLLLHDKWKRGRCFEITLERCTDVDGKSGVLPLVYFRSQRKEQGSRTKRQAVGRSEEQLPLCRSMPGPQRLVRIEDPTDFQACLRLAPQPAGRADRLRILRRSKAGGMGPHKSLSVAAGTDCTFHQQIMCLAFFCPCSVTSALEKEKLTEGVCIQYNLGYI